MNGYGGVNGATLPVESISGPANRLISVACSTRRQYFRLGGEVGGLRQDLGPVPLKQTEPSRGLMCPWGGIGIPLA